MLYEGKKFKDTAKKLYYPGGSLYFSNYIINKNLSFCDHIVGKYTDQLLIRPITIYEFPQSNLSQTKIKNNFNNQFIFKLNSRSIYLYKPNQTIKSIKNLMIVSNLLVFKTNKSFNNNLSIELLLNKKTNSIDFRTTEKIYLNNFILPNLKYKNLKSSFLVQSYQFVDSYNTLGYFEAITLNSLEIVKFKIKKQYIKQILLISNNDCLIIKKDKITKKKIK